jgi:hypothetical protein
MNENHGGEVMLIVRYKNGPIANVGGLNTTLVFRGVGVEGGFINDHQNDVQCHKEAHFDRANIVIIKVTGE